MPDSAGQRPGGATRGVPGAPAATPDPLARAARRWTDEVALVGARGSRTYGELEADVTALAGLLRDAVLSARGPGGGPAATTPAAAAPVAAAPVAFLLPRGPAAVACLHAVPRAGAPAAPLHPGWTESELGAYLDRLRPAALVCDGGTRERAEAVRPPGTVLVRLGDGWPPAEGAEVTGAGRTGREVSAEGPAPAARLHTILATSGSSGRPKAAGLTLENHLACAAATERRMLLGPADRWLASLSPAHVGGVALVLRAAWTGAALVLREGFDAGEVAELVERGDVTHASLVPTMLARLLEVRGGRRAPLTLRGILLGGDAAAPERVAAAQALDYPLFPTYGLTEAASQVATARPEEARRFPGTVGRPLDGTEVRIGEGEEILVRGPTIMAGYLWDSGPNGAPDESREPWKTADGWLRTGDAGRVDEEGRLWVTGRLSHRIVSGGVTVDPAEVEATLRAHPGVREAAVVGLPDPEWGERVAAAVVPARAESGVDGAPDAAARASSLEAALEAHCRERLAPAKRPRRFALVPELPRNPNGKVDRAAVRRLCG